MGRAVLFTILSFGIWTFYWFYRNRKLLDGEYGDRDDSVLHTCGLLVPVLNFVITYWLWRDLNDLRMRHGLAEFSVAGYLVGTILGLGPVFYGLALGHTNEYWDVRTNGAALDAPVTGGERLIVGIGLAFILLWALILALVIVVVSLSGN